MDAFIARIDLLNENAMLQSVDKTEYMAYFLNRGVPLSIMTRLEKLWSYTKPFMHKTICIGKIIVTKIAQFVASHEHTFIGIAIGIAIKVLLSSVPWLNAILSPFIKILTPILAAKGATLDYGTDSMIDALIKLARDFWHTTIEIFNLLRNEFVEG